MGGRRRCSRKPRRPSSATDPVRYLRLRLPDGSLGKMVPIVLYPRYSTIAAGGFAQDLLDVSTFRRMSVPRGGNLTIEVEDSEDIDLGWGGRPVKRDRSGKPTRKPLPGARRDSDRRRSGTKRFTGKQPQRNRAKQKGRRNSGGEG